MSEALEAAARAAYLANVVPGVTLSEESWHLCDAYKRAVLTDMARAAILAFLDAADVERTAITIERTWEGTADYPGPMYRHETIALAHAAIATLRAQAGAPRAARQEPSDA